ncbi:MAG TPA: thiamine monophosphate synthase, partial [Chromatiales bacterium]|nr:thiamine monophosphate synthase [Chromatiales bacterium]
SPEEIRGIGGIGLHLNSARLMALQERPAAEEEVLVGASCHNPEELEKAGRMGLDYALLSPVLPTASHPQAQPLGWPRFAELVEAATLPVFALGGMEAGDVETARHHGAQGIAAIRGLWPADR